MIEVTSTDFQNNFAKYLKLIKSEPAMVMSYKKEVAVLLSVEDYRRLTDLEDLHWRKRAENALGDGFAKEEELIHVLEEKGVPVEGLKKEMFLSATKDSVSDLSKLTVHQFKKSIDLVGRAIKTKDRKVTKIKGTDFCLLDKDGLRMVYDVKEGEVRILVLGHK